MDHYGSSLQHILAELERIDLLIQLQVNRARLLNITDEQFQGLVITEEEVDALLDAPAGLPRWATSDLPLSQPQIQAACRRAKDEVARKKEASRQQGVTLRLDRLQRLFGLSSFEVDVLLICLAPEIDLRYERLFGYLQDDVTKRRPSVDLVLNLLSPTFEAKLAGAACFTPRPRCSSSTCSSSSTTRASRSRLAEPISQGGRAHRQLSLRRRRAGRVAAPYVQLRQSTTPDGRSAPAGGRSRGAWCA